MSIFKVLVFCEFCFLKLSNFRVLLCLVKNISFAIPILFYPATEFFFLWKDPLISSRLLYGSSRFSYFLGIISIVSSGVDLSKVARISKFEALPQHLFTFSTKFIFSMASKFLKLYSLTKWMESSNDKAFNSHLKTSFSFLKLLIGLWETKITFKVEKFLVID